ncbi:PTS sugar transporter subunit IIB [Anaerococcus urinomassiliensis]|uniref:PTS sugar transporter subunit IIB n=1 Tax=Anaerococcus urinomassiliensis TaxID=1745712 RepID=UPI000939D752|nr:PTS sugar transporter subunit IIB [Anaerococcus urinomassiliensis]
MKVLFVCSMGMSSSMAVNGLKEEGAKNNVEIEVNAIGSSGLEDEIKNGYDIVMVAPQIRHRFKDLEEIAKKYNIPIELIEPVAYSPMGSEKLYEQAMNLYNEK